MSPSTRVCVSSPLTLGVRLPQRVSPTAKSSAQARQRPPRHRPSTGFAVQLASLPAVAPSAVPPTSPGGRTCVQTFPWQNSILGGAVLYGVVRARGRFPIQSGPLGRPPSPRASISPRPRQTRQLASSGSSTAPRPRDQPCAVERRVPEHPCVTPPPRAMAHLAVLAMSSRQLAGARPHRCHPWPRP